MAYWKEDEIGKWELRFFGKRLNPNDYRWIAHNEPGYFLLLLHIWNEKKWEHDWIWVDQPCINENGERDYIGKRTYDGLTNKVRAKGFDNKLTEYQKKINDLEEKSKQKYKEKIEAINKLQEIW